MALGLRMEIWDAKQEKPYTEKHDWEMLDYVWTGQELVDQICKAKGITRARFIRSMAAPKPSFVQHIIFKDELLKTFGEIGNLPDKWQSGRGLIIPKREAGEIVRIEFHTLSEMLRPRIKV